MGSGAHIEQVIPRRMVYVANLLFFLVVYCQSHLGGAGLCHWRTLRVCGGNCLLSLCLMSLCKNQKQREEKVRINKFLKDSKCVLEPAVQGDGYPSDCSELISSV